MSDENKGVFQIALSAAAALTTGGLSTVFTYAAYTYAAYNLYQGQKQARNAQSAAQASISDRLVTGRASGAPCRLIYGETRVAGDTIAYWCCQGVARPFSVFTEPI